MTESKVKDDNFFLVSGWMLNRLNLKGVSLQVFSIIYGFSQDGESYFTGSLQYLSDFTNASKPTIIKALKELVDKGYILKYENEMNGVKFNKYKANLLVVKNLAYPSKETLQGGSQISLPGGSKESLPNNIVLDNKDNINNNKDIYTEVIKLYHEICISYPSIRAVSEARKKAIKKILAKFSIDDLKTVFENAENSSFLKGLKGDFKASFDWLLKESNFLKTLEGNYADKPMYDDSSGFVETENYINRLLGKRKEEPSTAGNNPAIAEKAERLKQQLLG